MSNPDQAAERYNQSLRTVELLFDASKSHSFPRLTVIVAHPDDEVIGAGAQLPRWKKAQLVQVTDGAPRDLRDAFEQGYINREEYSQARRKELERAMKLVEIAPSQLQGLGFVDQEASLHLAKIVSRLVKTLKELESQCIVTHAYEGGHPDHDATAFAVHQACCVLRREGGPNPFIIEMASYFNRGGSMATGEFLPGSGGPAKLGKLSEAERRLKRRLFDCFSTQRKVLQYFPIESECFRPAPRYDFSLPPHNGKLYYELFDWGMTGTRWRSLAVATMEQLGLSKRELIA